MCRLVSLVSTGQTPERAKGLRVTGIDIGGRGRIGSKENAMAFKVRRSLVTLSCSSLATLIWSSFSSVQE